MHARASPYPILRPANPLERLSYEREACVVYMIKPIGIVTARSYLIESGVQKPTAIGPAWLCSVLPVQTRQSSRLRRDEGLGRGVP